MSAESLVTFAREGNLEGVKSTLEAGVDINTTLALHAACRNNQIQVVEHLLKSRPDINLDKPDIGGYTPAFEAASRGFIDILRLLIDRGADLNKVEILRGNSPLHIAAQKSSTRLEMVELLLRGGAEINLRNKEHRTPLFIACEHQHDALIRFLLSKGAKCTQLPKNKEGQNTIHRLAEIGDTQLCEDLLKAMPRPIQLKCLNALDNRRRTPVTIARASNHPETVEMLRNYLVVPLSLTSIVVFKQWSKLIFLVTQLGAFSFASAGLSLGIEYQGLGDLLGILGALDILPDWSLAGWLWLLCPFLTVMNMALVYSVHTNAGKKWDFPSLWASFVVFAWVVLSLPLFVPVVLTLASVADCTCDDEGLCTLDRDSTTLCWSGSHTLLCIYVLCVLVGYVASVARLVLVGHDARALQTLKDQSFFDIKNWIDVFKGWFFRRIVGFIIPYVPIAALFGGQDLFGDKDSKLFNEAERDRFLTQEDLHRPWQIPLLLLRLILALTSVFFSQRDDAELLINSIALCLMFIISFCVPLFENRIANGFNAGLHAFIVWTQVIVYAGVISNQWMAIGLYFGIGFVIIIAVGAARVFAGAKVAQWRTPPETPPPPGSVALV